MNQEHFRELLFLARHKNSSFVDIDAVIAGLDPKLLPMARFITDAVDSGMEPLPDDQRQSAIAILHMAGEPTPQHVLDAGL